MKQAIAKEEAKNQKLRSELSLTQNSNEQYEEEIKKLTNKMGIFDTLKYWIQDKDAELEMLNQHITEL